MGLVALLSVALVVPAGATTAARVVSHGSTTRPNVALTLDDGWTGAGALRLARVLVAKNAKATFFPYGSAVWASPAIFNWIASQPNFELANHTATHDRLCTVTSTGCLTTSVNMTAEITGGKIIGEGLTGRAMLPVLRTPGGNKNTAILSAAYAAGYPSVAMWNITAADTGVRTYTGVRSRLLKATNGAIMLAHMGPTTTMAALPSTIDGLRARGLNLITMSEMLGINREPALPAQDYAAIGVGPSGIGPRWQPAEVIDGGGFRHMAWTGPAGVWYATNSSGAWESDLVAASVTGESYYEQPSIALLPGRIPQIALTYETETATVVMLATHGASGWTLATIPGQRGFGSQPSLAVYGSKTYVAYHEQGQWNPDTQKWPNMGLYLATASGTTWSTVKFSMSGADENPSVAIDPKNGRPVIAFRARDSSGMMPLGVYLATRGSTSWSYARTTTREAHPSLVIGADGRRYLVISDAMSTNVSYASAMPGGTYTFKTIGQGLAATLVRPHLVIATSITNRRSGITEIPY